MVLLADPSDLVNMEFIRNHYLLREDTTILIKIPRPLVRAPLQPSRSDSQQLRHTKGNECVARVGEAVRVIEPEETENPADADSGFRVPTVRSVTEREWR